VHATDTVNVGDPSSVSPAGSSAKPTLSFSQMVRRGGDSGGPGSGASGRGALQVDDFPTLGSLLSSLPPPPPPPRVWGNRSELKQLALHDASPPDDTAPADGPMLSSLTSIEGPSSTTASKKKRKGQKVVLFSTGGQRGIP
jgi:hypothetical protein